MDSHHLQKILFICFIVIFLASFALMGWGLVLQFKQPEVTIPLVEFLAKLMIGEVVASIVALFYYTFNLKKHKQELSKNDNKEIFFSFREFLFKYMKHGCSIEIYCSGVDQFSEFLRSLDNNYAPKKVSISIYFRNRNDDTIAHNIESINLSLSKLTNIKWKIELVSLGWRLTFPSMIVIDGKHAALDYYINRHPDKPKNTMRILGKYIYSDLVNDTNVISKLIKGYRGEKYLENFILERRSINE